MKNLLCYFIALGLWSAGALGVRAGEVGAQAIVVAVTGDVKVTLPGQTTTAVVKAGDSFSQGATLTVGDKGHADVQVFNGAVATLTAGSTVELEKLSVTTANGVVTKQTALLNLKVGTVLSKIDPANHKINDYGVRTPKGVAAARGTAYGVTVGANGATQVFVTQSQVTFTSEATGQQVTVPTGAALVVTPSGALVPITAEQVTVIESKVAAANEANAELTRIMATTYGITVTFQSDGSLTPDSVDELQGRGILPATYKAGDPITDATVAANPAGNAFIAALNATTSLNAEFKGLGISSTTDAASVVNAVISTGGAKAPAGSQGVISTTATNGAGVPSVDINVLPQSPSQ